MRQSPEFQSIQNNMIPGALSAHGFLGDDKRNLADILMEDDNTVKGFGLEHQFIAEKMQYYTQIGKKGLGTPVKAEGKYEITVEEYMGLISCPFKDDYHSPKINTTLKVIETGITITWTDLNLHMIGSHGFYEGKGSFFRVDPAEVIKILEVHS